MNYELGGSSSNLTENPYSSFLLLTTTIISPFALE